MATAAPAASTDLTVSPAVLALVSGKGPDSPDPQSLTPSPAVLNLLKSQGQQPAVASPILKPSAKLLAMFKGAAAPTDTSAQYQDAHGYGDTDVVEHLGDFIGDVVKSGLNPNAVGTSLEAAQDIQKTAEAEYHNIGANDPIINTVKTLLGKDDYDVQLKSLQQQQETVLRKLDVLHRSAQLGQPDTTMQRAYEQINIGLSTQLSSLANQQIQAAWTKTSVEDSLRDTGKNLKGMLNQIKDNPKSTLHALGNSVLASPEFLTLGGLSGGAAAATDEADSIAETLGTSAAQPADAWTAMQDEAVANAAQTTAKAMTSTSTIANGLRGAGVSFTKPLGWAAVFTPLNVVAMYGRNGSVSPSDMFGLAEQGLVQGISTGAAGFLLKGSDPDVLPKILNTSINTGKTAVDVARGLGYDVDSPTKIAEAGGPTKVAGIETASYEGPNALRAALEATVKSGGTYDIKNFVNDEYFQAHNAFQTQAKAALKTNTTLVGARLGTYVYPDGSVTIRDGDDVGHIVATTSAVKTSDGLRIVNTETLPGSRGKGLSTLAHVKLAEEAFKRGGTLTSDWEVTGDIDGQHGAMGIWKNALPALGYKTELSDAAIFNGKNNTWVTTDGSPVWRISGRNPNAPSVEEIELSDAATDLQNAGGRIDPKLLYGMGAAGLVGVAAFNGSKTSSGSAVAEGATALAAAILGPRTLRGISNSLARGQELGEGSEAISRLDSLSGDLNTLPVAAAQIGNNIKRLVPNSDNLYKYLVKDPTAKPLTPNEQVAATLVSNLMQKIGLRAKASGTIANMVDDYFTRWWKPAPGSPLESVWNKASSRLSRTLPVGANGLEEAHKLGLQPITTDVGDIVRHYLLGMHRAIALRETAAALKETKDSSGELLVQPAAEAPRNYLPLHGALEGYKAHPDVAVLTNMLYEYPDTGTLGQYYDLLNFGLKRTALSFSLFHPKNLAMNYLMSTGDVGHLGSAFNPRSAFQEALRYGGPGSDLIKFASKNGLVFSEDSTPEDFGNDAYYKPLEQFSQKLDGLLTPLKLLPKGVIALSHLNDKIAFQLGQNYYKFQTWSRLYQSEYESALGKYNRHPDKYQVPNKEAIAQRAASVANDLYGSQNYYMMVRSVRSPWLRQVMGEVLSPSGRKSLQRGILAPDWTLSVARSFGRVATAGGLGKGALSERLPYARYLLGVASFYLAAAGTQQLTTGKWPWETDTPLGYIQNPDGSRTQWDKQAAEFGEYFTNPKQVPLNKLAQVPKLVGEALFNKQYLSIKGAPEIYKKSDDTMTEFGKILIHTGQSALPITSQQGIESGWRSGLGSFGGFPRYPAPTTKAKNTNLFDRFNRFPSLSKEFQ